MPIDLSKSKQALVPAVHFSWDSASIQSFYIRDGDSHIIDEDIYAAEPQLDIQMTKPMNGGVEDYPFTVSLPLTLEPLVSMIAAPHAPVETTIYDVDLDDLANPRCVFKGIISKVIARRSGKAKLCEATVSGRKHRLKDIRLGLRISDRCTDTFGGLICQVNVIALSETGSISSVSGDDIVPSGISNLTTSNYWERGFVQYQGLRIMIRRHKTSALFTLAKAPPSAWDGATGVMFRPGCDKTLTKCQFWANEDNHGAMGRKMPDHHPIIEDRP